MNQADGSKVTLSHSLRQPHNADMASLHIPCSFLRWSAEPTLARVFLSSVRLQPRRSSPSWRQQLRLTSLASLASWLLPRPSAWLPVSPPSETQARAPLSPLWHMKSSRRWHSGTQRGYAVTRRRLGFNRRRYAARSNLIRIGPRAGPETVPRTPLSAHFPWPPSEPLPDSPASSSAQSVKRSCRCVRDAEANRRSGLV
jgi:hypothetical protein